MLLRVEESLEALSGGTRPQLSALMDVTSPISGVALWQVHALRLESFLKLEKRRPKKKSSCPFSHPGHLCLRGLKLALTRPVRHDSGDLKKSSDNVVNRYLTLGPSVPTFSIHPFHTYPWRGLFHFASVLMESRGLPCASCFMRRI
jgi:hypothetical protein